MDNYYHARINKALKHIDSNLSEEISVQKLAELSGFSLFHFHRVFKAITSETPYESLLRLRLEKSIFLLKYRSELNISQIGFESGFSSPENFTRQFKTRYKITPGQFRKDKTLHNSRIYQETNPDDFYLRIEESRKLNQETYTVEIERLPEIPIAYSKAIFGMDGSGMIEKYLNLMSWAEKHNINSKGDLTRFGMSIDNPEVTPASKFRYDFAIRTFDKHSEEDGIEFGTIPEAEYATVHVQGKLENVAQAWDFLYKSWLPESDFVPVHYPAIEEFVQGPEEIGWENFNIKCRIPIIKQ